MKAKTEVKKTKSQAKKTVKKVAAPKKSRRKEALKKVSGQAEQAAEMFMHNISLPRKVVVQIADEVAKVVTNKIAIRRKKPRKLNKKVDNCVFLDTSAIIDMRVFQMAKIGALYGNFIVLESVLSELKNIADSKDPVKKERGRRAMDALDEFKKEKGIKVSIWPDETGKPVDEAIIDLSKKNKGRIITCDYNLSKKAKISNVTSVDLYELANILKTQALPGEDFFVKIVQEGKGVGQGVGYLPDGTMLVVEQGKSLLGKTVQVEVSRIIQTDAGKILFSKLKTN